MPTKKIAVKKDTKSKDALLQEIAGKLTAALPELKEKIGVKKFDKRIKKVSKLLIAGTKKAPVKKVPAKVKKVIPAVKKAVKIAVKKARGISK